ncbi:DNA adenine methylase [Candidatus Azambacteria bacterium]|nr:DNA adenine methylase [Candidatus Azambacteria bacterium]
MWTKFEALPNYFGGKRKLIKDIFKHTKKKEGVFIDAFLGGGSVSLWAKAKGYKVICNDIAERSYIVGKALIENSRVKITDEDLARLFIPAKHKNFIKKNYVPKVFLPQTAEFLDNAFEIAKHGFIEGSAKQYLMLLLLLKFIQRTRPFSKFTHTRYNLALLEENYELAFTSLAKGQLSKSLIRSNTAILQHPLIHLLEIKNVINRGVFENHQENEVHKRDIFDFLHRVNGDVVYFDPPYPGASAYENEYHVVDCIFAEKKIEKDISVFSKADAKIFLEKMLESSRHIPQWIISLGQTHPDEGVKPDELLKMVRKYRQAELEMVEHRWAINNVSGRPQGDNIEYIVHTL